MPLYGIRNISAAQWEDVLTIGTSRFGGYSVAQCDTSASGILEIPDEVYGLPITEIEAGAFAYCNKLTAVTMPDTVLSIGNSAFMGCSAMESIELSSSITTIESDTFSSCLALESVVVPSGVTSIGSGAFSGCQSAQSIVIPESVTVIEEYALYDCRSLLNLYIPSGLGYISVSDLESCGSLTAIAVSAQNPCYSSIDGVLYNKNVTRLMRCPRAKTGAFSLPQTVTAVDDNACSQCVNLTAVVLSNAVTFLGHYAFAGCTSLESIVIPDSVSSIEMAAFYGCSSLQSITLPAALGSFEYDVLSGCTSLEAVNVSAGNPNWASIDGVLYNKNLTQLILCPKAKTGLCSVYSGVTGIEPDAFHGCALLTGVSIPAGVTSMDGYYFYGCSALENINISGGNPKFQSIDGAMYNKTGTSLLYCPNGKTGSFNVLGSVTDIKEIAFNDCSKLVAITLPASVGSITTRHFRNCDALVDLNVSVDHLSFCSVDGVLYDKAKQHLMFCPTGKTGAFSVAIGTTAIEASAFYNCNGITSVTFPESLEVIKNEAFIDCAALSSVTLPGSLKAIETNAFTLCGQLGDISIADGVLSIAEGAFDSTAYFNNSENWENGVLYIDNYLIKANSDVLPTAYEVRGNTFHIADAAFNGCIELVSVTLPESIQGIGKSAFAGCAMLSSVNIPYGAENIGEYAFFICPLLNEVTIPDSVTGIGEAAFGYIYDENWEITINPDLTLGCYAATAGEDYAVNNGIPYILLNPKLELSSRSSLRIEADDYLLVTVSDDLRADSILSQFLRKNVVIYNGVAQLSGDSVITTGCAIYLVSGQSVLDTLEIVLKGDISKDGVIDAADGMLCELALSGHLDLIGATFKAANMDEANGSIDINDFSAILNLTLRK